jgi:hypothetical protein
MFYAVGCVIQVFRLGVLGTFQSSQTYPVCTNPESFTLATPAVRLRAYARSLPTESSLLRYL